MPEIRQVAPSPRPPQEGPACPTCDKPARYLSSILDLKNDQMVPIYRCDECQHEVWK